MDRRKNSGVAQNPERNKTMTTMKATSPNTIAEQAVCISITRGVLGNSKKVSQSHISERSAALAAGVVGAVAEEWNGTPVEVDADKNLLRVTKQLLDSPELEAIKSLDREVTTYINSRCLPSMFRGGVFLVPYAFLDEVNSKLMDFQVKREHLVEAFIKAYPQRCEEIGIRLKGIHNPTDYPAVAVVRSKFYFDWRCFEIGLPGKMKTVSAEIYEQERKKAEAHWTEAAVEIQAVLRLAMKDLVDHMINLLTTEEGGKQKAVRKSVLPNLNDFLDTFKARNIAGDEQLEKLVDEARKIIQGVDDGALKHSDSARTSITAGFSVIKSKLDKMVVDKPSRKITFASEDAA
jgi:hypothetical protein